MGEENCSNIESWKWQVEGEALRDFKRVKKVRDDEGTKWRPY